MTARLWGLEFPGFTVVRRQRGPGALLRCPCGSLVWTCFGHARRLRDACLFTAKPHRRIVSTNGSLDY